MSSPCLFFRLRKKVVVIDILKKFDGSSAALQESSIFGLLSPRNHVGGCHCHTRKRKTPTSDPSFLLPSISAHTWNTTRALHFGQLEAEKARIGLNNRLPLHVAMGIYFYKSITAESSTI